MNKNTVGKIYLVGAGPGDPELLTLKAVRILSMADIILVDALVNKEVLKHAKPDAEILEVGKRAHSSKSMSQSFINDLMIECVAAGQVVVRLKGGDPFIFGRGGEEVEFLLKHNIEAEVVSGVTSGIAVPAELGIPLTHRKWARNITFITGHSCDEDNQYNWKAIAENGGTIVIYMGLNNLESIITSLKVNGLSNSTPAIAIQNGTLPNRKYAIANAANLLATIEKANIGSPALVVIGEVVSLSPLYKKYVEEVLV